jgi:predicted nucleotidyltransferase
MGETSPASQTNLEEVRHVLKSHLPDLKEKYGVKSLGVFGSYVRGENRPRSDLDLLVEFDRAPTLFQFIRLERYLSNVLGV